MEKHSRIKLPRPNAQALPHQNNLPPYIQQSMEGLTQIAKGLVVTTISRPDPVPDSVGKSKFERSLVIAPSV